MPEREKLNIAIYPFMHNISLEIGRLADLADDIDSALGEVVLSEFVPPEVAAELQGIDVLRQSLEDLQKITMAATSCLEVNNFTEMSKNELCKNTNLESVREACFKNYNHSDLRSVTIENRKGRPAKPPFLEEF